MIVIVAMLSRAEWLHALLGFKQFCMHDLDRNIHDKNMGQLFPYYPGQYLGSESEII